MPSPAELAAKRRARLLARSQKGNGVKVVTAESLAEEQQGEVAGSTSIVADSPPSDESASPALDSSVSEPEKMGAGGSSATVESETSPVKTKEEEESAASPKKEENLDAILDAAVEETTTSTADGDDKKVQTPVEEKKVRPLAARREKILAAKRAAAAAAAAEDTEITSNDENIVKDGDEEGEKKKFSFISKTAREVELEIAQQTKQNDKDVAGNVDSDSVGEKVLMGREKGSTGSIRKRAKSGAGAGGSSSGSSSGGEASPKRGKGDVDVALERKIDILVKQQQSVDANWLPKLVRVLMLIALAAYAGYTSYLETPEGVSVMMLRKESGAATGFDRQFFDFSSVTGAAGKTVTAEGMTSETVDEAAFDEASHFGGAGAASAGAASGVPRYVPTFECSQAWADTTSISFTIIMVLGTISDRLLKTKTPGKQQDEGLAGYLSWFWEMYNQGYEALYEYIFNYIGEYAAYWMVIVAVSSGLSYASSIGSPLGDAEVDLALQPGDDGAEL